MLVASFIGSNRDFRQWLQARTWNVVGMSDYRGKRKAALKKAALRKLLTQV